MSIVRIPVRIDYPYDGGPGYNIWHARFVDSTPAALSLSAAVDALVDFYEAVDAYIVTGTTFTVGEGMILDPLGSPTYLDDDSHTVTGSAGGTSMSNIMCCTVGWRTTSATRSGRGRTFLGPMGMSSATGNGTPADATLTTLRAAASDLVDVSTGANGWAFGVLSTKQGLLRDFTGSTIKDRYTFLSSRRD